MRHVLICEDKNCSTEVTARVDDKGVVEEWVCPKCGRVELATRMEKAVFSASTAWAERVLVELSEARKAQAIDALSVSSMSAAELIDELMTISIETAHEPALKELARRVKRDHPDMYPPEHVAEVGVRETRGTVVGWTPCETERDAERADMVVEVVKDREGDRAGKKYAVEVRDVVGAKLMAEGNAEGSKAFVVRRTPFACPVCDHPLSAVCVNPQCTEEHVGSFPKEVDGATDCDECMGGTPFTPTTCSKCGAGLDTEAMTRSAPDHPWECADKDGCLGRLRRKDGGHE